MIILAILRVPAIPSLGLGALFAIALGWLHDPTTTITKVTHLIMNGYVAHTPNKTINLLLSRGGYQQHVNLAVLNHLRPITGGLVD